jgi:uncharacterized protein (TIGR03083 family)
MTISREEYLDRLAGESDALADAALAAGTEAPVPSCPGWTVADLLLHCIGGDNWARVIVETGSRDAATKELPDPTPTGTALVEHYREGAHALLATLAAADPDASVWAFFADHRTVQFWIRRRAQEVTLHRIDAELAAGAITRIDPVFASDGLDEHLTLFAPRFVPGAAPELRGSVHVHCTDVEGEWLAVIGPDGVAVTREHAKGDVAVRGPAEDLLLYISGRRGRDGLEVFGDEALLERFAVASRI